MVEREMKIDVRKHREMNYTGVGLDRFYFTLKGRKGAPEGMLGFQDSSFGF